MPLASTSRARTLIDLLFDKVADGLCLVAPDGTVVRANAEWLRSTGFSEERVVGENIIELSPDTRDMALALHARARAGHHVEVPRRAQVVNGRETWWEGSIEPVPMEGGMGLLITAREVTDDERRPGQAEEALRDSELLYRSLFTLAPAGVVLLDETGQLDAFNDQAHEHLGYTREEFARLRISDLDADEGPEDVRRHVLRVFEAGSSEFEARHRTKSGELRQVRAWSRVVQMGGRRRLLSVWQDVTEQKRTGEALRESEERFRAAFGASPDAININRLSDGAYVSVNDGFTRMSGWSAAEAIGKTTAELGVWADRDERARLMERLLADEVVHAAEAMFRRKDGTVFTASISARIFTARGERFLLAITRDVSDLKRAEQALRRHELVVQQSRDIILFMRQNDGRILAANPAAMAAYGYAPDELLGLSIHDLRAPETRALIETQMREASEHGLLFESRHRRKDGSTFPVEVSSRGVTVDGTNTLISVVRDITDRKHAEEALRDANERLRETDRLKDEFLGMLSHELRNPLAPIRNSTYILRHTEPGSEQTRRAQGVIERQTEHLTRLVDDLLDVTRIARGKIELRRERVDLREVVLRAADDFRALMENRGIVFGSALASSPVWVDADATRLTQVIGNLLHNAGKFSGRGDSITLSLREDGSEAVISVRDSGVGIEPAILPRLFEAFVQAEQTLARSEGGLGLGLAFVKGITELHGGTVRALSSGKGQGAEFVVRLPLAPRISTPVAPQRARRPAARRCRVLVVDDNTDAADSLAEIVEMLGHKAEVAYDGPTAVEKALATRPDVVLCDIGLPGMSGYEVAQALRVMDKRGTRLVALTGYAQPEDVKRATEAGFDGHVAKPCDPEQIERLLS